MHSHHQRVGTQWCHRAALRALLAAPLPSSPVNALLMAVMELRSLQPASCMETLAAAFLGCYCRHQPSSQCSMRERGKGEGLLYEACHCIVLTAQFSFGVANHSPKLPRGFSNQALVSLSATPGWVNLPPAACSVILPGGEAVCLPC